MIAPGFELPETFVTETEAVLGKRRSGKSYKASVIAEELLDRGTQIVVMDPTSSWWGLRSSTDGKRAGYPITIFGGEHGDIALDPKAGADIARAIVHERFSAILDLEGFSKGEEIRFSADFLEALYRAKVGAYKTPLKLFLDEADVYAPQKPFGDDARVLGACQSIVRRGGIKGIGCMMITQRPAVLNKDVLSGVDTLIALPMSMKHDLDAMSSWVSANADLEQSKKALAMIPSLKPKQAVVWSPKHEIFKMVEFRDRRTFDSGRTPDSKGYAPPKVLAAVDLKRLGDTLRQHAEEAKQNDPKALRARIAHLEKEAVDNVAGPRLSAALDDNARLRADNSRLVNLVNDYEHGVQLLKRYRGDVVRASSVFADAMAVFHSNVDPDDVSAAEAAAAKVTGQPAPALRFSTKALGMTMACRYILYPGHATWSTLRSAVPGMQLCVLRDGHDGDHSTKLAGTPKLSKAAGGEARIMAWLYKMQGRAVTKEFLAVVCHYHHAAGGFNNLLSSLRTRDWITRGNEIALTSAGMANMDVSVHVDAVDILPGWLRKLSKAESAILLHLHDHEEQYPHGTRSKDDVARAMSYDAKGGGFNNAISHLRSLRLIEGKSDALRATSYVFGTL